MTQPGILQAIEVQRNIMIDSLRIEIDISLRNSLVSGKPSSDSCQKWALFVPYDTTTDELAGAVAARLILATDIDVVNSELDTLIFGVWDENFELGNRPTVFHIQDGILGNARARSLKHLDPSIKPENLAFRFDQIRFKTMNNGTFNEGRFAVKDKPTPNPGPLLNRLKSVAQITTQRYVDIKTKK